MSGGMTDWSEITCQRGHDHHDTREVAVFLGGPTPYRDLPSIPHRFSDRFEMEVWDTDKYPVDNGLWCPAHDAVSETILSHGIWEPAETVLMLEAFRYCDTFIDIGAQLGWYSILAARWHLNVAAFEADPIVAEVCERNIARHAGMLAFQEVFNIRVDSDTQPFMGASKKERIAVKIDIEGAEVHAVKMLDGIMDSVDFMLIEISPCFNDTYPDLVVDLMARGFHAYLTPTKSTPPARLEVLPDDLNQWELLGSPDWIREEVSEWHQQDVLFVRDGAW